MKASAEVFKVSEQIASSAFKPRKADSRKGENGVVGVVGGSSLYHGAPTLTALAALRSGVDLVFLCVPRAIAISVRAISPNLIVIPLPDSKMTIGNANKLLKWLPKVHALAMGPGMGRQKTDGMIRIVNEVTSDGVKILLDADALHKEVVARVRERPAVITPHPGEFARVFGVELGSDAEKRAEAVKQAASESKVTILLKGRIDVISDGSRVALNHKPVITAAMTVGGTGDVLSGVVAGLMAKGAEPFEAAAAGAYVNGLAGERAAQRLGMHITATDVIEELPHVMKQFDKIAS